MAILGSTAKPTTAQEAWGLNSKNQFASLIAMPAGGPWRIYQLGGWLGGWNATPTGRLALWSASGSYLRSTGTFTVANHGDITLGDATQYSYALTSEYVVAGGINVYVGFVRDSAEGIQFPVTGSGTHIENTNSAEPTSLSGFNSHAGTIGAYLYYEASNTAPTAPTLVSPASGARLTDTTPSFVWDHNDPDGDAPDEGHVQVDTSTSFSSPDWSSGGGGNNIGDRYTRTSTTLVRGTQYYWRARTADTANGYGPWTGARPFKINRTPTVTKTSPVASGFPTIWNLATDLNVWAAAGAHAKPRFTWTFSDLDGDAQNAYQVRIWAASSGGTALYDSGVVGSSAKTLDANYALVLGTEYWWSVNVRDAYNEWSGESTRTAFKVKWSQAIYELAVAGGTGSSGWALTSHSTGSGQIALLSSSATGAAGAGRGAWSASVGSVVPNAYLNVLVRLASVTPGVASISLDDMTFNYIATAIQPERWVFGTVSADWALDPEQRRYGSQALRMTRTSDVTGERVAYPYTKNPGDDFPVTSNTEYTASVYVKTAAPLASGVRLEVRPAGGGTPWAGVTLVDATKNLATNTTADLVNNREGWQRISARFLTGSIDTLRLCIVQDAAGSVLGDKFWVDAIQLEESSVASPWRPGMVGNPVVMDVGGIAVDASAGGIFRLRGSDGLTTIDIDELVRPWHYVPLAAVSTPLNFLTTTADITGTALELTALPTTGVVAAVCILFMKSTVEHASNLLTITGYQAGGITLQNSYAAIAYGSTAYNTVQAMVPVGGTNGRSIQYAVGWGSGTVTYAFRVVGYYTES